MLKDGPSGLFKKVELQEPTFEHLVVIYRYQDKESPFSQLKQVRCPQKAQEHRFFCLENPRTESSKN